MKQITVSEIVPPNGPKWDEDQLDIWVELFQQFADDFIVAALADSDEDTKPKEVPEETLHGHLHLAARLADSAMKEVEYRFYNHTRPRKPPRRPRTKPYTAPARRPR